VCACVDEKDEGEEGKCGIIGSREPDAYRRIMPFSVPLARVMDESAVFSCNTTESVRISVEVHCPRVAGGRQRQ
jgi:hypothetical protein